MSGTMYRKPPKSVQTYQIWNNQYVIYEHLCYFIKNERMILLKCIMKRSLCCSLNIKVSEIMLFFKDNVDEMFYHSLKKKFILKRY